MGINGITMAINYPLRIKKNLQRLNEFMPYCHSDFVDPLVFSLKKFFSNFVDWEIHKFVTNHKTIRRPLYRGAVNTILFALFFVKVVVVSMELVFFFFSFRSRIFFLLQNTNRIFFFFSVSIKSAVNYPLLLDFVYILMYF